jgi:hypothetical protein
MHTANSRQTAKIPRLITRTFLTCIAPSSSF